MATITLPSGVPEGLAKIVAQLAVASLSASGKADTVASLTTASGQTLSGVAAIAKHVAGDNTDAYPSDKEFLKRQVDKWLKAATTIETPTTDADTRNTTLASIDAQLDGNAYLVNQSLSIADLAVAVVVAGLGSDAVDKYPHLGAWVTAVATDDLLRLHGGVGAHKPLPKPKAVSNGNSQTSGSSAAAGVKEDTTPIEAAPTQAPPAATSPTEAAPAAKSPAADAAPPPAADAVPPSTTAAAPASPPPANTDEDAEARKARRKAEKLAAKEAKAARIAQKAAEKANKAAAQAAEGGSTRRAKQKAEAEAKRAAEAEELQRVIAAARATPKGQKKDIAGEMPKGYSPAAVEAAWYDWWHQCGFFRPDDAATDKQPFVIVIPPPNVTGALHIGHALTNSIEDCVVRWRRMCGYNVLWVPGTDHAGIATQTVVEKKIQREMGKTRHDLGREEFLKQVFVWVDQYRDRINDQLSRLGSSVDWERKAFTMDETRSAAVKAAFLQLHEKGLIYRDNRLVNWDCVLKTAVSDIEVDYIDIASSTKLAVPGYDKPVEFGVLTSFAYPLEDGSGEIVVATTRPETMLGDTAVAVHPEDPRYTHMHGKHVVHPVDGRLLPIICDAELVDMSFGTGAVKITPAHDPNDFATGKRHNLQFLNMLTDDGLVNNMGGELFAGQPRFKARVTIVDYLKQKGLFRGTSPNPMRLGICSRSKDVIEPMLKPQWWVACKGMADAACEAVRDGRLQIIPKDSEATWFRWLENIRDWCISRQLWWGHRIPAWYVLVKGDEQPGAPGLPTEHMDRWVVAEDHEGALKLAAARFPGQEVELVQDEDVLDTWFSSGLFPFSVFGWPEQTPDLAKYYPNALLETGHDILFFWVARMVMMGMTLTGKVPFKTVYLHTIVRDAHGRKMSKSLGNVVDPIHVIEGITLQGLHDTLNTGNLDAKEITKAKQGQKADYPDGIEECGTDALRLALMSYTSSARDINLDIKRVVVYRHWCNKLWNAIRFAMLNLGEGFVPRGDVVPTWWASLWIRSRLNAAVEAVGAAMQSYEFGAAVTAIYKYWQYELCDVYIEVVKPTLRGEVEVEGRKEEVQQVLWLCLETGLRLLHPFMPFVTEELWQRLPKGPIHNAHASIMIAPYPTVNAAWAHPAAEAQMNTASKVITAVRSLRAAYGLTKERPHLYVKCKDGEERGVLEQSTHEIATLSTSEDTTVIKPTEEVPKGCGVMVVDENTTAHILLAGILDVEKELAKLGKKKEDLEGKLQAMDVKMSSADYATRTPEDVRTADAERLAKMKAELAEVEQHLVDMKSLQ